jgi:hypothetical protein
MEGGYLIKAHHWIEGREVFQPRCTLRSADKRAAIGVRSIAGRFLLSEYLAELTQSPHP